MKCEIVPFADAMLEEAGRLLALRHARQRRECPELSVLFEDAAPAQRALSAVWQREWTGGVAAVNGSRLLGYMVGDMVFDPLWERSGWVRFAGCALDPDQDAELLRDLYAALSVRWIQFGCFRHFAIVSVSEAAQTHQWFTMNFGIEKIHGLQTLKDEIPATPPDVEIRMAGPSDRQHLIDLSGIIWQYQVQAPDWGIHLPETEVTQPEEYGALVEDPQTRLWLAFLDGQAVGVQGYGPLPFTATDLMTPERCVSLDIAGTLPEARGRGIGQALLRLTFAHAYREGHRVSLTDWRSANLLASRFWPKQGYRPIAYRLSRRVDPRICWASGLP